MVTDNTSQTDETASFLRAARSGNLERVIQFLDADLDINSSNPNGLNALHLCSKEGHVEIVTELLKRGAKVDAATKKGNTALHIASLAGKDEIVNILIQYGAAVNTQSQNGFTPLYMAAQENHDHVVKLLLRNGANQSLATEDGFTPLAVAMQQGHDKVVSVLLESDSKGKVRLPALHIAARKDDCKAAELLLQNDHKPDVTSKSNFTPLHIAAHYGNEDIARLLIKRGADVNYLAKHNISPLHVAAKWGKNNLVKILLESSALVDAKTRDGLTPLHCAARSGHEQVISTLLENAAPISARTKNGLAPLHMASQGDHVGGARVLLFNRAPVDEVTTDYLTSLHVAAHCGHVRVAKLLLDRNADPNARALNGFTPLHVACKKNRIKVVELLLKHGASIESTTESGLTPLHVASFMGCMNIVIFLLQHEASPDVPTVRGETPLHLAARANQTDIIRILLRNGAKVDARARELQTPLHIAARLGNVDIVMLLLQHGATADTATKDMYTALHVASKEGQEEVAAILLDNNASICATTTNGFTPLHFAAKYGNMNVTKLLLQKGAAIEAQDKHKITPLLLACHYDHPNVAQLLLDKGASPHTQSQNGHTPLHIVARKNQMDIATALLEHGANPNTASRAGFTPLHLSAQKGHYDMTNLLIEHGGDPNKQAKNGLAALHLCAQEDFIKVASVLVKHGAEVECKTVTGYRPVHVAAHFGNLSMIKFLLKHNAGIDVKTSQSYTPLHQAAQQGHAHVVSALIEADARHRARTNDGLTALNIAQKLGYISVMEVLKGLSYDGITPDNKNWEEKYKVIAPESLQETSMMSDSDDEGVSDALISEQPYQYLTADLMKSLQDDSLPIDVTGDDPSHKQMLKQDKVEFVQSNNYCLAESFDESIHGKLHIKPFLVSFIVDARGGAMKGCRHSGIRIVVPPRRAAMPIRVTCKLIKPSKVPSPPPQMDGEALATRVVEMGPVGASFIGPVLIDIPHSASVNSKDREIIILRSDNGEQWKEHDNSSDNDDHLMNSSFDPQMSTQCSGRIIRIITREFPQYFAVISRVKQEVHVIGAEGGILMSSADENVEAVFPPGALTKKIKVGLQAHVIPAELTAKLLGNCVAVSPVVTIEPRRRKFHKPITITMPAPRAANKGMINQYAGETPTLRLLYSIAGGTSEAQWEDVTGSTPLNFINERISFTTTVSARFLLIDCRNIEGVPKMATELYKESLFVPYITNFIIYSKRLEIIEATLRILCMTDGRDGICTLERQEDFTEIVKSRDVEVLDGKDLYIEFTGNLVPVTKSGVQLKFTFKAFRQNRLSFHVKVKDPLLDPVARMLFMKDPKVPKGEPQQQPLCVLNILLPETICKSRPKKTEDKEDSNILSQKQGKPKTSYDIDKEEKRDEPKSTSPTENKFIVDTMEKEHLESIDASYPKVGTQDDVSPCFESQTYSEKRKFWEDITRKRDSYQRSESEVSRASQLTFNESDTDYLQNIISEDDTEAMSRKSDILDEDVVILPDMSECSVAEKAHYFEEQIQKEITAVKSSSKRQSIVSDDSSRISEEEIIASSSKEKVEELMNKEKHGRLKKDNVEESITEMIKDVPEILMKDIEKIKTDKIIKEMSTKVVFEEKTEKSDSLKKLADSENQFKQEKEVSLEKIPVEDSAKMDLTKDKGVEKELEKKSDLPGVQKTDEEDTKKLEALKAQAESEIQQMFTTKIQEKRTSQLQEDPTKTTSSTEKEAATAKTTKKDNGSRIPVFASKTDKSKTPKPQERESEQETKKATTELEKKKESRIPRKVGGKDEGASMVMKEKTKEVKSETHQQHSTKLESERFGFSREKSREKFEKSLKEASGSQDKMEIFAKTDKKEVAKQRETSLIETSKGSDKKVLEEEKEHVTKKETTASSSTQHLPEEKIQKNQIKVKESDNSSTQKTSVIVTDDRKIIDAASSGTSMLSEEKKVFKVKEDESKVVTEASDTSKIKGKKVQVSMKLEEDFTSKSVPEMVKEKTASEDIHETSESSSNVKVGFKDRPQTLNTNDRTTLKKEKSSDSGSIEAFIAEEEKLLIEESEARDIAETIVKSIENEIQKRGIIPENGKKSVGQRQEEDLEESYDDKLADDLTRKFETLMQHEAAFTGTILEKEFSFNEDIAKEEESSIHKDDSSAFSLSQTKFHDRDITISPSSISEQTEMEEGDLPSNDLGCASKSGYSEKKTSQLSSQSYYPESNDSIDAQKGSSTRKEVMFSEVSGAKVLEILEPGVHSRQDSMDVPSLEIDDVRMPDKLPQDSDTDHELETKDTYRLALHESMTVDSLNKLDDEHDITISPSSVSEDVNTDFPLLEERPVVNIVRKKKGDSFEINSPPMIPSKSRVAELEIKPGDWLIGEDKIEILETLQPSEEFNRELEKYQSPLRKDFLQDDEPEDIDDLMTKSLDDIKHAAPSSKSTIVPVNEDLEEDLIENKLDISCQELVAALQTEHDKKTPTKEIDLSSFIPQEPQASDKFQNTVESSSISTSIDSIEVSKELARKDKKIDEEVDFQLVEIESTKAEDLGQNKDKIEHEGEKSSSDSGISAFGMMKEDLETVDLGSKYAITVLDEVVKQEIAQVKESLQAAKQDLIDELNETESIARIKDSPSEFQFAVQQEAAVPRNVPLSYKASPSDHKTDRDSGASTESPVAKPRRQLSDSPKGSFETKSDEKSKDLLESNDDLIAKTMVIARTEPLITVMEELKGERQGTPSPISRSGSDAEYKDDSSALLAPQPVPRRRHKTKRTLPRVTSDSDADVGSSSEGSQYQSCEYESRPSSSDVEALHSAVQSGTYSEYETALMTLEHSSDTRGTSQDYHTAASTLSSRESMKSLNSLSSGHLGSIDSTSELSETLVASDAELDKDDLENVLEDDNNEYDRKEELDVSASDVPFKMKRSSEMIFQQVSEDKTISEQQQLVEPEKSEILEQEMAMTSEQRDDEKITAFKTAEESQIFDRQSPPLQTFSPERKLGSFILDDDNFDMTQTPIGSLLQQASMSTSSTSAVSLETVIDKDAEDRRSPDSDSFELVDKPDIIDDFVVIEEVGKEAEEFDSEGKSIRIGSKAYSSSKNYDREVETLITDSQREKELAKLQEPPSTSSEVFGIESEESPPQASNEDQYSQSYSDEEQYDGNKKWAEMQFQQDPRMYDIEYDRGPLEDIKEEEVTDFEAGSSRFGSLGSHKESIGSVGSMRGSFGSTPEYDALIKGKYFIKPTDHDNVSLSSLQEFEHLENAIALDQAKKLQCGSQDSKDSSSTNGSLPRKYTLSKSGHGDDVSLSSLKDFEGLETACFEAHMIELKAREEQDLLDHESPESRYKLEMARAKVETSTAGSKNPSTSGSDDYEKRIREIDEIIRIAQANVEKLERQDDTGEDISQIEGMELEKNLAIAANVDPAYVLEPNVMETSTDSLELEDKKDNLMCRSSDSLEMKTTLDYPSLSYSDSLNNFKDSQESKQDSSDRFNTSRRISSDSLELPALEDTHAQGREKEIESNIPRSDKEGSGDGRESLSRMGLGSKDKTKSPETSGT